MEAFSFQFITGADLERSNGKYLIKRKFIPCTLPEY